MKKFLIFFILTALLTTSCSLDNGNSRDNFRLEFLPIESVDIPEVFTFGETHEIFIDYIKPTDCYVFNNFLYQIDGQERIVGIINTVYLNEICETTSETVTVSFQFNVTSTETYIFKFYQGQDDEGVDQYQIIEVPVSED